MEALLDMLRNMMSLDEGDILSTALDKPETKDLIIKLNTEEQLFKYGEDAEGRKLRDIGGDYSPFTVEDKLTKGLPTDHITLFNTGRMYESETVRIGSEGDINMEMDTIKDGEDIQDRWGPNIVGLTDASLNYLIEHNVTEDVINETESWIWKD